MSKDVVYDYVTERIVALLEKGVVPWRKTWATDERFPMNLASGKTYRGINVFMLAVAGYGSPYWLTRKQIVDRGGHIREGEKANMVVFYSELLKDKNTGAKLTPDEARGRENVNRFRMLRYSNVWNVEQCEGVEYPKPAARDVTFNPIAEAESIRDGMPNRPQITHNEQRAYYRPSTDVVNMPKPETFTRAEEYYATLFHELTHSTAHASRLDRRSKDEDLTHGSTDYAKEELVAEMGASFLNAVAGTIAPVLENSAAYIAGWLRSLKNDRKLVVSAASAAHKAADYILNKA